MLLNPLYWLLGPSVQKKRDLSSLTFVFLEQMCQVASTTLVTPAGTACFDFQMNSGLAAAQFA